MSFDSPTPVRVCYPFIGDLIGGSYIGTRILIEHLDRSRFQPIVVLHRDGDFAAELREQRIEYDLLPVARFVGDGGGPLRHMGALARTVLKLKTYLKRRKIDLVHTNESPIHETWVLPARLSRRPLVWHQRGRVTPSRLESVMRSLASRYVCISHFVEDQLPEKLRPLSQVIDNPFLDEVDENVRRAARCDLLREIGGDPAVVVGFCGHLLDVKRPEIFVEAAGLMAHEMDKKVSFVMMGQDQEGRKPALLALAQSMGLSEALHILPFRENGPYWIGAFDLLLAPAVGEGFGRAVVEATLAGVPVVAANAGGHIEIIRNEQTGLLVAPDDANALARAGLRLLGDESLGQRITSQARLESTRRFSAGGHARQIENLYLSTLGHRSG